MALGPAILLELCNNNPIECIPTILSLNSDLGLVRVLSNCDECVSWKSFSSILFFIEKCTWKTENSQPQLKTYEKLFNYVICQSARMPKHAFRSDTVSSCARIYVLICTYSDVWQQHGRYCASHNVTAFQLKTKSSKTLETPPNSKLCCKLFVYIRK